MSTDDARTQIDPLSAPRIVRMVRRFDASRARVFRSLSDPEEMVRWFAEEVRGSLAAGTRTTLVFPHSRTWWDTVTLENDKLFEFRWPWLPGDTYETTCRIELEPQGYGTQLTLTDGPFDLRVPGRPGRVRRGLRGLGRGARLAPRLGRLLRGASRPPLLAARPPPPTSPAGRRRA